MSLKKNAIYNASYQIVRLIFPLITYPYVSRIIGPEGIGQVSYAQTIMNYFKSFILLGIPIYATREISRSRAVPGMIDKVYSELIVLSILLTTLGSFVYAAFFFLFPSVAAEPELHWGFGLVLVFYWAQLDWFYQGIEKYKYITIRNLITRIITACLIFVIIHEKSHYTRYGFLWIAGSIVACLWNFVYSLSIVKIDFKSLKIGRHLKQSLPSAFIAAAGMLYAVLDTIMLGSMLQDNRYSVGLYSVAGRLMRIAMSIVISGNAVLGPRVALKDKEGDEVSIIRIIRLNLLFTIFLGMPVVMGMIVTAEELMTLFAGESFSPAIITMKIVAPELLLLAIGTIIGSHILYYRGKEKRVLIITLCSLVVAFISNYIAIPLYKHNGAAIATVFTRSFEVILLIIFGRQLFFKVIDLSEIGKILLITIFWVTGLFLFKGLISEFPILWRFVLTVVLGVVTYPVFSFFLKVEPMLMSLNWINAFLHKRILRKK